MSDQPEVFWLVTTNSHPDTLTTSETEARERLEFLRRHFPENMTTLETQVRQPWQVIDDDSDWWERRQDFRSAAWHADARAAALRADAAA